eukprot:1146329-Pelagomonas_calceolata.AAC.1
MPAQQETEQHKTRTGVIMPCHLRPPLLRAQCAYASCCLTASLFSPFCSCAATISMGCSSSHPAHHVITCDLCCALVQLLEYL